MRAVYREINIIPAAGLRDFYVLVFIYKYYNRYLPGCFEGIFCETSDVHQHDTQARGGIEIPRSVSNRSSVSIIYRVSKLWNKLSTGANKLDNLNLSCDWNCLINILLKHIKRICFIFYYLFTLSL